MPAEQSIEARDCGPVKRIVVPSGWTERNERPLPDGRYVRTFFPPGCPKAHLCLYFRPIPISLESGTYFMRTLVTPFHDLTSAEFARLESILEGMAVEDAFEVLNAGTGYLNGKRVLRIVGRWRLQGTKTVAVLTNGDSRGCVVMEVYYSAPEQEFDSYLEAASAAMESVEWSEI